MRFISGLVVCAALVLVGNVPAAAATPPREHPDGIAIVDVYEPHVWAMIEVFNAGIDKINNQDNLGALKDFQAALAHEAFGDAPATIRYQVYYWLAWAESEYLAIACYNHLRLAGEVAPTERDADYWLLLASCTDAVQKEDAFVDALLVLAESYPDQQQYWLESWVPSSLRHLKDEAGGNRKFRLLRALWINGYQPPKYRSMEVAWQDLLQLMLDRGLVDDAKRLMTSFRKVDSGIWLAVDKRLSAVAPADAQKAVAALMAIEADDALQAMVANPDEAWPIYNRATVLLRQDRAADALTLLDDAIARIATGTSDKPAFDDPDEYEWIYNGRAFALMYLGRWDEAVTAQELALEAAETYSDGTIAQRVNLGYLLYLVGRPEDALAALGNMTTLLDTGSYGIVAISEVMICANQQLGDIPERDRWLEIVRSRTKANFMAAIVAHACVGNADELAELFKTYLDDADTRMQILLILQHYRPRQGLTEFSAKIEAVMEAVRKRPDVMDRASQYGRQLSWPLQRDLY